jgi:hypothetical protein
MSSAQFSGIKIYQRELDFFGVTACYFNGNLSTAFNIIRVVLLRNTGEEYFSVVKKHRI